MANENVDPNQLLKDLQQIAIVCQRLGIDLGKVAAMGQTLGGKGAGGSPLQTQNSDHAVSHKGGGTGYENLATGQIIGSVVSEQMRTKGNTKAQETAEKNKKVVEEKKRRGITLWVSNEEQSEYEKQYQRGLPIKLSQGPSSEWLPKSQRITNALKKTIADRHEFGMAMDRKFNRQFTTIHGLNQVYGALTSPVNEAAGETRFLKIAEAFSNTANLAVKAEAMAQFNTAQEVYSATRAAGATRAGAAGRAVGAVGRAAVAVMLVQSVLDNVSSAVDLTKEQNRSKAELARLRGGFIGDMHLNKKDDVVWVPPPLPAEAVDKFNAIAGGEGGTLDYYIDEHGNRHERSWFGKFKQRSLFIRLYNRAEELQKEKEWRYKSAQKAHESAQKKAEIMDWHGAIEQVNKAKEAIPIKEAQPFFWREPERYLRSLESSRLAARNWARSQQPRGASRTGD